jgi:hypothetical protein
VILTANVNWDPSDLDHEQEDDEEWFNNMSSIPDITIDPLFDNTGEYRFTHQVTEAILSESVFPNHSATNLPMIYSSQAANIMPLDIDHTQH